MPIKPIQGVGLAKSLPRMRSNLCLSNGIANSMQQMLRRNVVLDISVAFGKTELMFCQLTPFGLTPPFILNNDLGHRSRSVTDVVLETGLGTTFGYLYWYGMYTASAGRCLSHGHKRNAKGGVYRLPRTCYTETRSILREA